MEFYSAIRKNETTWSEYKWMQLEDIILSEISQAQKDKSRMFFSQMWKIDPKDKHIHKTKHDHIQTSMYNMFVIAEQLHGTRGRRERKREW
jgi:hypothetical protein